MVRRLQSLSIYLQGVGTIPMIASNRHQVRNVGMTAVSIFVSFLAALILQCGIASSAELTGVITSRRGLPLSNVKVIIRDTSGKVISTVTTDKNGQYRAPGLKPATYTYTVDGAGIGFTAGSPMVAHLPPQGLSLNWTMTSNAALASASAGPSQFQMGSDNVSNFFSGMSGPVGSNGKATSSNSEGSSSTDPTSSASSPSTSGPNGPGVPGGPSGMVGGVPVGAVIIPVTNKVNNPTPTPPPVSPSS